VKHRNVGTQEREHYVAVKVTICCGHISTLIVHAS